MPDFKDLLNKPLGDVKRPPPPPQGTYYGKISKFELSTAGYEDSDTGEKARIVRYSIVPERIDEDSADADDLKTFDITKAQPFRKEFSIENSRLYILVEFLQGFKIKTVDRALADSIPEAVGQRVMFDVTHTPNKKDPEAPPYVNVGKCVPEED